MTTHQQHIRAVRQRLNKYPPSAIRSWMESHLAIPGHDLHGALAELNEELGTAYRMNRLYEWRAGSVSVPDPVREFAQREALHHVLSEHGIRASHLTDEQIASIVEALR